MPSKQQQIMDALTAAADQAETIDTEASARTEAAHRGMQRAHAAMADAYAMLANAEQLRSQGRAVISRAVRTAVAEAMAPWEPPK